MIYDFLIQPFADNQFMRYALVACLGMSIAGAPLGVFLTLRRLTLAGDALSHSVLPGVAVAYLFWGASFWALTLGGLIAGIAVTILTVLVSRNTVIKEDASFGAAYMLSLAAGIMIISSNGDEHELMHLLFGHIEEITADLMNFSVIISGVTLVGLAVMYRPLIMECVDPVFMRAIHGRGGLYNHLFLILIVLNLICVFQALGTLLALGIMLVPAVAARFWSKHIDEMIIAAIIIAVASTLIGLLVSYHGKLPTGPSVVITAGVFYIFSILFGTNGIIRKLLPHHHLAE